MNPVDSVKNNSTVDMITDALCFGSEFFIRCTAVSVTLISSLVAPAQPVQENHQPSTPTLPDLEELNQAHPFYADLLQKYSDAFDETHAHFLDQTYLSADDLSQLKEEYLAFITHQVNKTPGVEYNNPNFYAEALEKLLTESPAKLIETTITVEQTSKVSKMDSSLAYQWKEYNKNKNSSSISNYLNKLADAHGLIQVIGWSTQNENSLLAILDAWNYGRYADNIAETRSVLRSLLDPIKPLFIEYENIAHREKNTFLKIVRTAIPMLIIAGFVISMTALIPVALPELAFVILAVPLLYLSFALVSLYVKTKDLIYQGYRHLRYQDNLELFPEFTINDQLEDAFTCKAKAEEIRAHYIQAIQACDLIEDGYKKQKTSKKLELTNRAANLEQRNTLIFEWFDLRDNSNLGTDETPLIALQRLRMDKNTLNQAFKGALKQDELEIKHFVNTMAKHLQKALLEEPEFHDAEEAPSTNNTLSSLRFFPSYAEKRDGIIQLQALETQIAANLQI